MIEPFWEKQECVKCLEDKPTASFRRGKSVCRACERARLLERLASDAEFAEGWRARKKARKSARRARLSGNVGRHSGAEWLLVLAKAKGRCALCLRQVGKLTKDHIEPLALGGTDFIYNIQAVCGPCNSRKNAKPIAGQMTLSLGSPLPKPKPEKAVPAKRAVLTERERLERRRASEIKRYCERREEICAMRRRRYAEKGGYSESEKVRKRAYNAQFRAKRKAARALPDHVWYALHRESFKAWRGTKKKAYERPRPRISWQQQKPSKRVTESLEEKKERIRAYQVEYRNRQENREKMKAYQAAYREARKTEKRGAMPGLRADR